MDMEIIMRVQEKGVSHKGLEIGFSISVIDDSIWGNRRRETKIRDKYIKIRVRYSGKDLVIISALKTLYTVSYA